MSFLQTQQGIDRDVHKTGDTFDLRRSSNFNLSLNVIHVKGFVSSNYRCLFREMAISET